MNEMSKAKQPSEAAEHLRECGPFCEHVDVCADCENVFGLCAKHAGDPCGSFSCKK
jgi:hypothetical protein